MSEQTLWSPAGVATGANRTLSMKARKALRDPKSAIAYVVAIVKGRLYVAFCRAIGRRVTVGKRFRMFGRLSVRGPGEVIIGNDIALWGRVNAWTYSADAQIVIEDNVILGGPRFGCVKLIRVGRDSILADASIRDTDFHSTRADRRSPDAPIRVAPVVIGRNVWIATGAILLPGTSIGENSVVGAAAVCMRSFPADKVILGNPAKVAMPIASLGEDAPANGLATVAEEFPISK